MKPLVASVRSAANIEEAKELWWPLMRELEWNRGEDDIKMHFHVAKGGQNWLLIIPDHVQKAQGSLTAFAYDNKTGWIGFFILNASFRRQGLGRQLWTEMEAKFYDQGTTMIGLDGVEEQRATYERRGFVTCAQIPVLTRASIRTKPLDSARVKETSATIYDIHEIAHEELAKLDHEHTGLYRPAYWSAKGALAPDFANGFGILSGTQLTGFVLMRRCEHGYRIGPVLASTPDQAKQLLHKAMSSAPNKDCSFIAEIFGMNDQGLSVFEELGWKYAGVSYNRMWLNGVVPVEQQKNGRGATGMYAIFDACAG